MLYVDVPVLRLLHSYTLDLILAALIAANLTWLASNRYRVTPARFLQLLIRVWATRIYGWLYSEDEPEVRKLVSRYAVGLAADEAALATWSTLETAQPSFRLESIRQGAVPNTLIPFVYESRFADYLVALRRTFCLDEIIARGAGEYDAMLCLGAWLGTRWDHGTDELVDTHHVCNPTATIEAGRRGSKYWCEIAARTAVHAFTSLGWVARVVTGSRDGYTWEHAVAEVWCNQFGKWVILDTDFNVVYERDGIPLSAWELCREGLELHRRGRIFMRRFAPMKPSLTDVNLIPFYEYIHLDLRNDWCSRSLRPGSPVGGDLATWWTARPSLGSVITASVRVDDASVFNWSINQVILEIMDAHQVPEGGLTLKIGVRGYSPTFVAFQARFDLEDWRILASPMVTIVASPGRHCLQVRMMTASGFPGEVSEVRFLVGDDQFEEMTVGDVTY